MNPKTGEVLAMATRPSYNPNKFWDYQPEAWKNKAVSFIYEPGSTFKAVVAAAALQEKTVTPNQVFVDPGYVMVSGRRIQNWSGTSFGTVTFTDVVKQSLNTGFAQVGLRLGAGNLIKYAKAFGFGVPTGIDLPAEEGGILFNPEDMRDSDIATMSIGQSIAVTPLQLVTAMSAIANDGVLLKPHIIKSVRNADGSTYEERDTTEVRRTIDSATDKTLVGLLEQVVASGGGSKAAVKGYRIGGKTGTAQKIREDGSGYMEGRYIASFCGFAPVEDPQLTVLVMIDDPGTGNYYGGQIAAPVASRIFAQLFRYLHIEPSSDPFAGMAPSKSSQPKAKTDTTYTGEIPDGKVVVPSFAGKSLREAARLAADRGLSFESDGSGYAAGQSIPLNTLVDKGSSITVYFKPD
jgi:stage V sporulation protein D (sporulation-specific penicillin-binding protein)